MKPRRIEVAKLKSGMVLSEPVRTPHGQMLAKAGTVLNHQTISRFKFYHIPDVLVEVTKYSDLAAEAKAEEEREDEERARERAEKEAEEARRAAQNEPDQKAKLVADSVNINRIVSYSQKLEQSSDFQDFQVAYSQCTEQLKAYFDRAKTEHTIDVRPEDLEYADALLKHRTSLDLVTMILSMRSLEDTVYTHSLNVALISRLIGKWLRLPKAEITHLTQAAILHDIGKTEIPDEILNKKGKLTDEEFAEIRKHPIYGNSILKEAGADLRIRNVALQHHERYDGSGYPRGLAADEIDDYAGIVAIADVYDAMTAARPYRAPLGVFQVIEQFEKEGYQKYNTKFILVFLSHMASLFHNTRVTLSDGRTARIVYLNRQSFSHPIVELTDGSVLDLSRHPDLHISATL